MNLSLKQYRSLDLGIFAVLICVFETLNIFAITQWFKDELFTFSLLIPLSAIVLMRWGRFGVFHAGLSGLAYCVALSSTGAVSVTFQQYVIYILGNSFAALSMLLFLKLKKDAIAKNAWYSIMFVAIIYLAIEIGRGLVALCFGSGFEIFVHFLTTDALSAVVGVVIVLIARKQNGLFEDQILYLRRLEKEKEEQRKLKDDGML